MVLDIGSTTSPMVVTFGSSRMAAMKLSFADAEPRPISSNTGRVNCHPPRGESTRLAPDITHHEPHVALFGGEDGLDILKRIAAEAPAWMKPGAFFGMEMDPTQAPALQRLWEEAGMEKVRIVQDLAGLLRFVVGRKPQS